MKKNIILLMLAIACTDLKLIAQQAGFKPANSNPLRHRFVIQLPKSNQVIVELTGMEMLPALMQLDSIIRQAYNETLQLSDSSDMPIDGKKIEVVAGPGNTRKYRMTRTAQEKTFVMSDSEMAMLKVVQDTLLITNFTIPRSRSVKPGIFNEWQIMVMINSLEDIPRYTTGVLDSTMKKIAAEYAKAAGWSAGRDGQMQISASYDAADSASSAPPVYQRTTTTFQLVLLGEASIQNYANMFTPSLVFPAASVIFRGNGKTSTLRIEPETFFFFNRNTSGKLEVYPNTFLSLRFTRKPDSGIKPGGYWPQLLNSISIGYLTQRKGDYFENNTFKIAVAGVTYKTLTIQPQFFFHDFFKQASPSVRLGIAF